MNWRLATTAIGLEIVLKLGYPEVGLRVKPYGYIYPKGDFVTYRAVTPQHGMPPPNSLDLDGSTIPILFEKIASLQTIPRNPFQYTIGVFG